MRQSDLFSPKSVAEWQTISLRRAELVLCKSWLNENDAATLFRRLSSELEWSQPYINMAGKKVQVPRLQAWYGDPNAQTQYSGERLEPIPWHPSLVEVRLRLQKEVPYSFNSVLVNLYRDGQDGVGWHADDEKELGENPCIASLSLGSARKFAFKPKRFKSEFGRERGLNIELGHGDLLLMSGETQKFWQHSIPKTKKTVGPRINLTFRQVIKNKLTY